MIQRIATTLVVVAGLVAVACVDMSSPKGAASISVLQLPSPSVVRGDSMRDSNGVVAPITINVYDGNGNIISDAKLDLFITDTLKVAHLTPENVLVGDALGSARLLGQVSGLQTSGITVPVTNAPVTIAASGTVDTLTAPAGTDSALTTASATLSAVVKGASNDPSQGIVVRYSLAYAPATRDGSSPAVYIADNTGHLATADTTSASGSSSRRLVVTSLFLADEDLRAGNRTDSAVVLASASYRGAALDGSPIRFVVPIKVAFVFK